MALGLLATAALAVVTGTRFLVVEGGSMRPTLNPGDLLVVRPAGSTAIRPGDIVSYARRGAAPVTHRVVTVRGSGTAGRTIAKGDANTRPDHRAYRAGDVGGKVVAVLPKVGMLFGLLRTRTGFALGVLIPALALAASELWRVRNAIRRQ